MDKCPSCGSPDIHRSRSTTAAERLKKRFTDERLHRCRACGWRGWGEVRTAVSRGDRGLADDRTAAVVLDEPVAATSPGPVAWDAQRKSRPLALEQLPPQTEPLAPSNGNGRRPAGGALEAGDGTQVGGRFSLPGVPRGDAASISSGVGSHSDTRARKAATWPRVQVLLVAAFLLLAIGILVRACLVVGSK